MTSIFAQFVQKVNIHNIYNVRVQTELTAAIF